jgi:hypothetical protein
MLIENFQLFPIRARFLEFESIFVSLLIGIDWKFIMFFYDAAGACFRVKLISDLLRWRAPQRSSN